MRGAHGRSKSLGEAPSGEETLGELITLRGARAVSRTNTVAAALPYIGTDVARAQRKLGVQTPGQIRWESIASEDVAFGRSAFERRRENNSSTIAGGDSAAQRARRVGDGASAGQWAPRPIAADLSAANLTVAALMQAMGVDISGGRAIASNDAVAFSSLTTSDSSVSAAPSDYLAAGNASPAESDDEDEAEEKAASAAAFDEVYAALGNVPGGAPRAQNSNGADASATRPASAAQGTDPPWSPRRSAFAAAHRNSGDFWRKGAIVLDVEYMQPMEPRPWSRGHLRTITLRLHNPASMTVGDLKGRVEGALRRFARAALGRAQDLAVALAYDVARAAVDAAERAGADAEGGSVVVTASRSPELSRATFARRAAQARDVAAAAGRCVTVRAAEQRLFNRGHVMKDHDGLSFYNLTSRSVVLLGWFAAPSASSSSARTPRGDVRALGDRELRAVRATEPATRVARRHEQQHKRLSVRLREREAELAELRQRAAQPPASTHDTTLAAKSSPPAIGASTTSGSDSDDPPDPRDEGRATARSRSRARRDLRRRERRRRRRPHSSLSADEGGECSFVYHRYISRESCSQFDSLPLTYLTISSLSADEGVSDGVELLGGVALSDARSPSPLGDDAARAGAIRFVPDPQTHRRAKSAGCTADAAGAPSAWVKWRNVELERAVGERPRRGGGAEGGVFSDDAASPRRSGRLLHTLSKGFHTVRRITRNLSPKPPKRREVVSPPPPSSPSPLQPIGDPGVGSPRMNPLRDGVSEHGDEAARATNPAVPEEIGVRVGDVISAQSRV